jgi:hypothetical protein
MSDLNDQEHEKPREWTLLSGRPAYRSPSVAPVGDADWSELPQGESVRVVEAEPVEREREEMLGLLEEACWAVGVHPLAGKIQLVLDKHGRLTDD